MLKKLKLKIFMYKSRIKFFLSIYTLLNKVNCKRWINGEITDYQLVHGLGYFIKDAWTMSHSVCSSLAEFGQRVENDEINKK